MRHRIIALSAAFGLALAACGGTSTSPSTIPSPSATTAENELGDACVYAVKDVMYGVQSRDRRSPPS